MKRYLVTLLAVVYATLALFVTLALLGYATELGIQAHIIPASLIYSAVDALGLAVKPDGVLVRSAHGPPFLGPVGILLCYGVPTVVLTRVALRLWSTSRRRAAAATAPSQTEQ